MAPSAPGRHGPPQLVDHAPPMLSADADDFGAIRSTTLTQSASLLLNSFCESLENFRNMRFGRASAVGSCSASFEHPFEHEREMHVSTTALPVVDAPGHAPSLPRSTGPVTEALIAALRHGSDGRRRRRSTTSRSSTIRCTARTRRSRCTRSTNSTTAGSTESTTSGSGTPTRSVCDADSKRLPAAGSKTRWRSSSASTRSLRATLPTSCGRWQTPADLRSRHSWRRDGTLEQLREFAIHRSLYSLKEADPHSWAIPRLRGATKAALVTIQTDEYGSGHEPRHALRVVRRRMEALGLDSRYGAYLDLVPGEILSTVNLMSFFGLHRRWRGAIIGHLALFEMCSVVPMGRYIEALNRLGVHDATPFYAAHVIADEWHQTIALDDMVGSLVLDEPQLADDIVFGASRARSSRTRFHPADSCARGPATRPRCTPDLGHRSAVQPMTTHQAAPKVGSGARRRRHGRRCLPRGRARRARTRSRLGRARCRGRRRYVRRFDRRLAAAARRATDRPRRAHGRRTHVPDHPPELAAQSARPTRCFRPSHFVTSLRIPRIPTPSMMFGLAQLTMKIRDFSPGSALDAPARRSRAADARTSRSSTISPAPSGPPAPLRVCAVRARTGIAASSIRQPVTLPSRR